MTWLKTDHDFGFPYVEYTVGIREIAVATGIRDVLKSIQEGKGLDTLEDYLLKLIEFHRPNMKGGSIVGICYRHGGMGFVIEYAHPLAPRMKRGDLPTNEPLIPQERLRDGIKIEDEPIVMTGNS